MSDLTLYNLTDEIEALETLLILDEGEITAEFEDLEKSVYSMIQTKTDGCVGFLKKRDDLIASAKGRIDELREFIRKQERVKEGFHNYVFLCMDKLGKKELKGHMYSFKERAPSKCVTIEDEDSVPMIYTEIEVKKKIKLNEIKAAIKSGEDVPGAKLVDGKRSLSIKLTS